MSRLPKRMESMLDRPPQQERFRQEATGGRVRFCLSPKFLNQGSADESAVWQILWSPNKCRSQIMKPNIGKDLCTANLLILWKCVPKGPINNIPALVQIMAWRRPCNQPFTEPMVASLLTNICITRPQSVNKLFISAPKTDLRYSRRCKI